MVRVLEQHELRARAANLAAVLTDVDGVLTDGGVYYSERGEELKRFSLRDGMGVELLRRAGLPCVFVTGEVSGVVVARARKLGVEHVYQGVKDKAALLPQLRRDLGVGDAPLGYIGDDVNDIGIIEQLGLTGLTAAPCDAHPSVVDVVHLWTDLRGGHGAFREFADVLVGLRKRG